MKSQPEQILGKSRRRQKRLPQSGIIGLSSVISILVLWWLIESPDATFRLSMATAYTGLFLLVATLLTGPINLLKSRANPLSTDLRRDLGIGAAVVSLIHVGVGLQVHLGGKAWLYFLYPRGEAHLLPFRYDPFGIANYTGLLATLLTILLLAISNDLSLRLLGGKRWKAVQRLNYGLFGLVALHAVAYQLIEKRPQPYPLVLTGALLLVIALQGAGWWKRRQQVS